MGKRVSAVAVLLATSFLGSLLALVLVGRNPLVGPSSDLAKTESLREGIDGSPITVPGAPSPSPSSATSGGSESVDEAVRSATEAGSLETAYRPDPGSPTDAAPEGAPAPTGTSPEPAEEDDASLAKTTSEESDGGGNGNGNANGHDKDKGASTSDDEPEGDAVDAGSTDSPKGGPKEPKESKASKGGNEGGGGNPSGEKSKGSGKGPKVEKDKGSGEGAELHGKGKSKS